MEQPDPLDRKTPTNPDPGLSGPDNVFIRLQSITFDPLREEPSLPPELTLSSYPGNETYYILQFDGPVLEEWKSALEATGVQLLGYIPDYAFVVKMTTQQKETAAAHPHVRWIGLYQPGYKISPNLPRPFTGREKITLLVFPGGNSADIQKKIQEWGGIIEESSQNLDYDQFTIEIDLEHVVGLAGLSEVMWIELRRQPGLN